MFQTFRTTKYAKDFIALSTLAGAAYIWIILGSAFVG
jgi:hypothetical protein